MSNDKLLEIRNLKKYFPVKKTKKRSNKTGYVKAVDDVSFSIKPGETFGLVGESGCGKSTLSRLIMRLISPDSGEIYFNDNNFMNLRGKSLREQRKDMQMIFQNPYESLNPRMTAGEIIAAPFQIFNVLNKNERYKKIESLLEMVGLSKKYINRYPHEFSGGQRQRIGIARAIALNPKLIICDEAVSGLDVSVQSQILNLLNDLQDELEFAYLFISHDLSVVKYMSDRIGVMYSGKIVEIGGADEIYENPRHSYTQRLLSSILSPEPDSYT